MSLFRFVRLDTQVSINNCFTSDGLPRQYNYASDKYILN